MRTHASKVRLQNHLELLYERLTDGRQEVSNSAMQEWSAEIAVLLGYFPRTNNYVEKDDATTTEVG